MSVLTEDVFIKLTQQINEVNSIKLLFFLYYCAMKQSQLFTKTRKDAPKDEVSKNAQLLIGAGFIHKEMAGVYSLLPLGFRVINNIKKVIASEMEKLGSSEIIMSTIQNKKVWEKTDRWDDKKVDVWFKSKMNGGSEIGFGWSHEEPITEMMKNFVSSYKDLPTYVHQFQNKLRNEVRAKSGIMRCREFIMKDMYAFSKTREENDIFYTKAQHAYMSVFKRIGLGDITYITSASGGVFSNEFSHEFQTVCDAGEDIIYVNEAKKIALNKEIFNEKTLSEMGMKEGDFVTKKVAEVGNIFNFGTEKCEKLELFFKENDGTKKPVFLSSYGIGVTRLMGVIAEVLSDDKGLVWPKEVAPFTVHLISIEDKEGKVKVEADKIYKKLVERGEEVLYDDRDMRPGEKFADSDLIGIPKRIVVSSKTLEQDSVEVKDRATGTVEMIKNERI